MSYYTAYRAAEAEAERHGLDPLATSAHAWATGVLAHWGYPESARPDIISGARSAARQRYLQRRWDRGERAGLVARPADRSWHLKGRAVDVEDHVSGFPLYAWLLTTYTGARDGRTFGDPGHFDWPTSSQPPSIWT